MSAQLERYGVYLALIAAWVALCGSLYFSEVVGYLPCRYCWFQRILMYPLAVILAVGILAADRGVIAYALPLSAGGVLLATYHYLIQKTTIFGVSSCQVGIPCSTIWINWLGFMTIPFLAMTAFLIITVMLLVGAQSYDTVLDDEGSAPWLPVSTVIGAIIALFVTLGQLNSAEAAGEQGVSIDLTPIAQGEQSLHSDLDGAQLYATACAVCHGEQGEGVAVIGVPLVGSDLLATSDDAALVEFVKVGRAIDDPANQSKRLMPPYGGNPALTDPELRAIIQFIRSFEPTGDQ